jgi:hypothetical protein
MPFGPYKPYKPDEFEHLDYDCWYCRGTGRGSGDCNCKYCGGLGYAKAGRWERGYSGQADFGRMRANRGTWCRAESWRPTIPGSANLPDNWGMYGGTCSVCGEYRHDSGTDPCRCDRDAADRLRSTPPPPDEDIPF